MEDNMLRSTRLRINTRLRYAQIPYHLYIIKSYIDLQKKEGVAQKLSLPRPFLFWNIIHHKSVNFKATDFIFWI